MGRRPCCSKEGLNRGAWTALEDKILSAYIKAHGEGKWRNLPKRAGLKRCGKSCRLRWLNYLRPDIKRGNISHDEEELIIRLHNLLGNRWSLIAGRLPGRTDNEIKNYWNTTLGKKAKAQSSPNSPPPAIAKQSPTRKSDKKTADPSNSPQAAANQTQVIRTKAIRCTKVLIPELAPENQLRISNSTTVTCPSEPDQVHESQLVNNSQDDLVDNSKAHCGTEKHLLLETCAQDSDLFNFGHNEFQASHEDANGEDYNFNHSFDETMFKDWTSNFCLEDNATLDLDSFAFLFD